MLLVVTRVIRMMEGDDVIIFNSTCFENKRSLASCTAVYSVLFDAVYSVG